jgi:hypothetical protein
MIGFPSPVHITSDLGVVGRLAWNNKTDEKMANELNCCWGNIYWGVWSVIYQDYVPHRVDFLFKDFCARLLQRLVDDDRTL